MCQILQLGYLCRRCRAVNRRYTCEHHFCARICCYLPPAVLVAVLFRICAISRLCHNGDCSRQFCQNFFAYSANQLVWFTISMRSNRIDYIRIGYALPAWETGKNDHPAQTDALEKALRFLMSLHRASPPTALLPPRCYGSKVTLFSRSSYRISAIGRPHQTFHTLRFLLRHSGPSAQPHD